MIRLNDALLALTRTLPCHRLRLSQILLRVGIIGIESYGLPELGQSLVHPSLLKKSNGKVGVGVGIVGIDFQGLLVMLNRLVHLPFL